MCERQMTWDEVVAEMVRYREEAKELREKLDAAHLEIAAMKVVESNLRMHFENVQDDHRKLEQQLDAQTAKLAKIEELDASLIETVQDANDECEWNCASLAAFIRHQLRELGLIDGSTPNPKGTE